MTRSTRDRLERGTAAFASLPAIQRAAAAARAAFRVSGEIPAPKGIACRRGCCYCCTHAVEASPGEAQAAADYAIRNLSPAELDEALERATAHVQLRARTGDMEAFAAAGLPCAFLDLASGDCRIYPARPLACRAYHSLDREACRHAAEQAARRTSGPKVVIPMDGRTAMTHMDLLAGFAEVEARARARRVPRPRQYRWQQWFFPRLVSDAIRNLRSKTHG